MTDLHLVEFRDTDDAPVFIRPNAVAALTAFKSTERNGRETKCSEVYLTGVEPLYVKGEPAVIAAALGLTHSHAANYTIESVAA